MELNRGIMKKLMLLIAFGIAFYLCLSNLYRAMDVIGMIVGIFQPILLGLAFAFILNVLMRLVETRLFAGLNRRFTQKWPRFRRSVSILVTLLIVICLAALLILIVIPELVRTITSLTDKIPEYISNLQNNAEKFDRYFPVVGQTVRKINVDWNNLGQMLAQSGQSFANTLVGSTVSAATNVAHAFLNFVLGMVFALNLLAQKEKLSAQCKRLLYAYVPRRHADRFIRLCSLTFSAFSNFIAGQCTEACILGTLCFIGMSIFRFPFALLISAIVAVMALIPIFGAFFSVIIGCMLIFAVNPIQAFWFAVFFLTLQQLEGNLIFPHVVGSKVGLPALWVLAAVTVGGNSFGLVGMLLSIPLFSVLYTLLRENVRIRLARRKKEDGSAPEELLHEAENEDPGESRPSV